MNIIFLFICASMENTFIHSFIHWSVMSVSIHEETLAHPRWHCSNKLLCKVLATNTADNRQKALSTFSLQGLFHYCAGNA